MQCGEVYLSDKIRSSSERDQIVIRKEKNRLAYDNHS